MTASFISSACWFFAFTVFSAYTEFAQYFVVWNANMPTETFWYLIRERGNVVVGEHDFDFRPFLRAVFPAAAVKAKSNFKIMSCPSARSRG
jgi:hypothetical protein